MQKKWYSLIVVGLIATLFSGCGSKAVEQPEAEAPVVEAAAEEPVAEVTVETPKQDIPEIFIPDGEYVAKFDTDSSMFHINEAHDGKGILTVKDGEMNIHISLPSKSILNLYPGLAEDAEKEGAVLLVYTIDTVTYSDGTTEEVHGFDVPVPYLEEEFDLALVGTKGKWYDHKVKVSDPIPVAQNEIVECYGPSFEDGEYSVELALEGGTGKATIESPAKMVVKDGNAIVTIKWSSSKYDYMIFDGVKYEPVTTEGGSVFELPIFPIDEPWAVIADTTAMSTPHEIEYTITCTLK